MNKKLLVAGLAVSVAINLVAVFTFGFYWREELRRRHDHLPPPTGNARLALGELKERFQLNDAQMDTMRVLFEFRRTSLRPVRDRLDAEQAEILTLLQSPELNRPRVDSLLQGVIAAQDSLETGSLGVLLRMRNTLTSEQRIRLPELFGALQQAGGKPRPGAAGAPPPGRRPLEGPPGR